MQRLVYDQHDAKKRDVQLERTLQQWQRLSNENARVSTASSRGGMLLLNPIDPIRQLPRAVSSLTEGSTSATSQCLSCFFLSGLILGSCHQRIEYDNHQSARGMRSLPPCDTVHC